MDTRAINHVLTHSSDYQKPSQVRYNLSQLFGEGGLIPRMAPVRARQPRVIGVLFVEGTQHRQQVGIFLCPGWHSRIPCPNSDASW